MRRAIGLLIASGLTLALLPLAQPVAAAQTRKVYACKSSSFVNAGSGAQTVYANPGDTVVLYNNCHPAYGSMLFRSPSNPAVFAFPATNGIPRGGSTSATVGAIGRAEQVALMSNSSAYSITTITIISQAEAVPILFGPPAHGTLQQALLPASGSCDDVPPETGHWHDAPFGGWNPSWAWWPNQGTGGPVCSRELAVLPDGTVIVLP